MALKAVSLAAGLLQMTFGAVVHFLVTAAVVRFPKAEHAVSPDVAAVAGNAVFLVLAQGC